MTLEPGSGKPSSLSTHVLDTAEGIPAAGMAMQLWRMDGDASALLLEATTDADGRTPGPLLDEASFLPGRYELRFRAGDYFSASGRGAGFLDVVTLAVVLRAGEGHYHVPLLCSPWSWSTYRGS